MCEECLYGVFVRSIRWVFRYSFLELGVFIWCFVEFVRRNGEGNFRLVERVVEVRGRVVFLGV